MARDRDLGSAAGRRGDRMTVFNLIRDELLGQTSCPRSPLSPAASARAVMVLGVRNTVQLCAPAAHGPVRRHRSGLSPGLALAA